MLLEIIEIKPFARFELLGKLDGLLLIDSLLGILDQRQDIAHAENTRGHSLRVEGFDTGQFLADTSVLDRPTGYMTYRKRCATTRITVQFGQDDSGQRQSLAKRLGRVDRILTQHGINDEQCFNRFDRRMEFGDLLHHRFVNRETTSRIHKQHIVEVAFGPINRSARNIYRPVRQSRRKKIHTGLLGDGFQLFDSRRTINVAGNDQHFLLLRFP